MIAALFEEPPIGGITFEEHPVGGYRERTIENVRLATLTIAIAKNFNTPGEKLTKNSCVKQGRAYFPVDISRGFPEAAALAYEISTMMMVDRISLNIAGNGIYNLTQYGQEAVDSWVYSLLLALTDYMEIESVRSGGQTGIDEAGAKAGTRIGCLTTVLAPKGWLFRDIYHVDHSSKEKFIERFR